jgi:Rieske Fe-S protein
MSGDAEGKNVPRRDLLSVAVAGSAAALFIAGSYPVLRYLEPPLQASTGPTPVGKLEDFPVGSVRMVLVAERPVFIIRTAEGVRAFSAICTHLQCVLQYAAERRRFECPCHGGVYDIDGTNVEGPPPRPLEELAVTVSENTIIVGVG